MPAIAISNMLGALTEYFEANADRKIVLKQMWAQKCLKQMQMQMQIQKCVHVKVSSKANAGTHMQQLITTVPVKNNSDQILSANLLQKLILQIIFQN